MAEKMWESGGGGEGLMYAWSTQKHKKKLYN